MNKFLKSPQSFDANELENVFIIHSKIYSPMSPSSL